MKTTTSREKRSPFHSQACLVLRDGKLGSPIAGPGRGSLVNISTTGAAVEIAPIRFGKLHLVYSPQADTSQVLYLEIGKISLPTRPIWFHRVQKGGVAAYRVGVEFVTPPDALLWRQLAPRVARKRSWFWDRFFPKRNPGAGKGGRSTFLS